MSQPVLHRWPADVTLAACDPSLKARCCSRLTRSAWRLQVDDLIATGGTLRAGINLIRKLMPTSAAGSGSSPDLCILLAVVEASSE